VFEHKLTAFIIPYVIIGALTKFQNGGSTSIERGWTMSWLVCSEFMGLINGFLVHDLVAGAPIWGVSVAIPIMFVYDIPAIGGFAMVGIMISEFGTSTYLSNELQKNWQVLWGTRLWYAIGATGTSRRLC
jgi:hypothetical protein